MPLSKFSGSLTLSLYHNTSAVALTSPTLKASHSQIVIRLINWRTSSGSSGRESASQQVVSVPYKRIWVNNMRSRSLVQTNIHLKNKIARLSVKSHYCDADCWLNSTWIIIQKSHHRNSLNGLNFRKTFKNPFEREAGGALAKTENPNGRTDWTIGKSLLEICTLHHGEQNKHQVCVLTTIIKKAFDLY